VDRPAGAPALRGLVVPGGDTGRQVVGGYGIPGGGIIGIIIASPYRKPSWSNEDATPASTTGSVQNAGAPMRRIEVVNLEE
jgi:hypothetical protein